MGRLPIVRKGKFAAGQTHSADNAFSGTRMHHHCVFAVIEHTGIQKIDFSADCFLSRRTNDADAAADLGHLFCQCRCRTNSAGADNIMAAAMTDSRKRIVFGNQGDSGAGNAGVIVGTKRRLEIGKSFFYKETLCTQEAAEQIGRKIFLQAQFGMLVNAVGNFSYFLFLAINFAAKCSF